MYSWSSQKKRELVNQRPAHSQFSNHEPRFRVPLQPCHEALCRAANGDPHWVLLRCGDPDVQSGGGCILLLRLVHGRPLYPLGTIFVASSVFFLYPCPHVTICTCIHLFLYPSIFLSIHPCLAPGGSHDREWEGVKWRWHGEIRYWRLCLACHQRRWDGDGRTRNRHCRPRSPTSPDCPPLPYITCEAHAGLGHGVLSVWKSALAILHEPSHRACEGAHGHTFVCKCFSTLLQVRAPARGLFVGPYFAAPMRQIILDFERTCSEGMTWKVAACVANSGQLHRAEGTAWVLRKVVEALGHQCAVVQRRSSDSLCRDCGSCKEDTKLKRFLKDRIQERFGQEKWAVWVSWGPWCLGGSLGHFGQLAGWVAG